MKASAIEFRLRMPINIAIVVIGFYAPWTGAWGLGRRIPLLEWLPLQLSRLDLLSFAVATRAVIAVAALIAAIGAVLRIWGSAWLGPATVLHPQMKAGAVLADGPYRYVRNPLYLGVWCVIAALGFLMPPTGALFTMVLLTVFLLRLTLGEEAFLATQIGEPYQAYLRAVPRFIPRLREAPPPTGRRPHWVRAVLSELTPIGVFLALAFLTWSYDYRVMAKAIVVGFGIGLVGRALVLGSRQEPSPSQ